MSRKISARGRTRLLISSFSLALAALALPAAAQAGPLVASSPDCEQEALSQPFLPWLDPAQYQFAPDGGFESGGDGWALDDGAGAVAGNESFSVHGADDASSLALPAGASATSPTVCVGLEHPTVRMFAKRTSGFGAALAVEVLFEDAAGSVHSLPIGGVSGLGGWQPTAPMPVVANLLPLLPGEYTPIQVRVTAVSGSWRIDDVYVDPMRRS